MANEHYEAAEESLSEAAQETNQRYEHYHLARAQVEATLAVAHELHTANLIAAAATFQNGMDELTELASDESTPAPVRKAAADLVAETTKMAGGVHEGIRDRLDLPTVDGSAYEKAIREAFAL